MRIDEIETPALVLDRGRLDSNLARMRARADALGAPLRPHFKTAKSVDVMARALNGAGAATVSTLREAECLHDAGISDLLYAVGMAPSKLDRAAALRAAGAALTLTVDSLDAARALAAKGAELQAPFPAVIEIDSDGHRAGVKPLSEEALAIARVLHDAPGASFAGLMTHAGESYNCKSPQEIARMAEQERRAVVDTAAMLAEAGIESAMVSVGSTPTMTFAERLDGVTEARVGVYMFQDLVMAGLGCCAIDDIALSVLGSVIGHQRERGWVITDAGWMALSRDRGTAGQAVDHGYGAVCDLNGAVIPGLIVVDANQEHGVIARRDGGPIDFDQFPIGLRLRVLPNHACATAGQHERYHVVDGGREIIAQWRRVNGW